MPCRRVLPVICVAAAYAASASAALGHAAAADGGIARRGAQDPVLSAPWPASAARADVVVAAAPWAFSLTAYRGAIAWAARTPTGSRVAYRAGGVTRDVGPDRVAAPSQPDLGPSRDAGRVVMAVTNCPPGRRCRLEVVDLRDGAVREVHGFSAVPCARLIAPSTWRGAFAVIGIGCGDHGPDSRSGVERLYYRGRTGPVRSLEVLEAGEGSTTDLNADTVAVLEYNAKRLSLVSVHTARRRVVSQGDESLDYRWGPVSPALDGATLSWIEASAAHPLTARSLVRTRATLRKAPFCAARFAPWAPIAVDRHRVMYLDPTSFGDATRVMRYGPGLPPANACAARLDATGAIKL